jgi:hypothetical protein
MVGLFDRQIVNRSDASPHRAISIEFPVLVSERAEPVAAVIMPLISKPDGDAVIGEGPQFFDQAVIEFLSPFAREKGDDLGAPIDEFCSVRQRLSSV